MAYVATKCFVNNNIIALTTVQNRYLQATIVQYEYLQGKKEVSVGCVETSSLTWPDSTLTESKSLVNCHRVLCSGTLLPE